MEKKGLVLTSLLFLINFASAYGERSGLLVGNMYFDIDLIISVGIFMTIFVALSIATRKISLFHTEGARLFVSFTLAMFSIYGLSKASIDYQTLFIDWGIQQLLMDFGAWILLASCLLIIIIYNIRTLILVASAAFIVMGFTGMYSELIVYNWEISLMIGIALLLFFLWLRKKGGFRYKKSTITPGMARLDIITTKEEKKYANGYSVQLPLGYRQTTKFYIRNGGDREMQWKIDSQRGLRVSKTRGVLSGGMHAAIGIKNARDDGHPREISIWAKGVGESNRKYQHAKIIIFHGNGPKQDDNTSHDDEHHQDDNNHNDGGNALFGIKIGGQTFRNAGGKTIKVAMNPNSETTMAVFNEGTGEDLIWTRKLDSKVFTDKSRGRVRAKREENIELAVKNATSKTKRVIVYAKGDKAKGWQQATIIITLDQSERVIPSRGTARFDVTVGDKQYQDPEGRLNTLQIGTSGTTKIYVKNGGSGGNLFWRAAVSEGLSIDLKEGNLKKGKISELNVTVTDASIKNQKVTIIGKRGADKGVRTLISDAVGKVKIPIDASKVNQPAQDRVRERLTFD